MYADNDMSRYDNPVYSNATLESIIKVFFFKILASVPI